MFDGGKRESGSSASSLALSSGTGETLGISLSPATDSFSPVRRVEEQPESRKARHQNSRDMRDRRFEGMEIRGIGLLPLSLQWFDWHGYSPYIKQYF